MVLLDSAEAAGESWGLVAPPWGSGRSAGRIHRLLRAMAGRSRRRGVSIKMLGSQSLALGDAAGEPIGAASGAAASLPGDACGPDRARPFCDLAGDERLQEFRRAPFRRDHVGTDLLEPRLHGGRRHRGDRRLVEPLHDRRGRALGEKEYQPVVGETRQPSCMQSAGVGKKKSSKVCQSNLTHEAEKLDLKSNIQVL